MIIENIICNRKTLGCTTTKTREELNNSKESLDIPSNLHLKFYIHTLEYLSVWKSALNGAANLLKNNWKCPLEKYIWIKKGDQNGNIKG